METENEGNETGFTRGKRLRQDGNDESLGDAIQQSSSKEFLSVPFDFIFRLEPGARGKPLLSRVEAHTLIQISELANRLDIIVDLSAQALERRFQSRSIQNEIENIRTFWSLYPYLFIHGKTIPNQALLYLQSELTRVLDELSSFSEKLKEYSERNYDMSESLMDFTRDNNSSGHALATEKRILGDIEEEVSLRIEHLVSLQNDDAAAYATFDKRDLSMTSICNRLLNAQTREEGSESTPSHDVNLSHHQQLCVSEGIQDPSEKRRNENGINGLSAGPADNVELSRQQQICVGEGIHDTAGKSAGENEERIYGLAAGPANNFDSSHQHKLCVNDGVQEIAEKSTNENETGIHGLEDFEDSIDKSKLNDETQPLGDAANTQCAVSVLAHLSNGTE